MTRERLTAALQAASRGDDGGLWALETLSRAPGCLWLPPVRTLLGKVRTPARLAAGDWRFAPSRLPGGLPAVHVAHEVRGVRLAESDQPLAQCAAEIADAVWTLAASFGAAAQAELDTVVEGLERATRATS